MNKLKWTLNLQKYPATVITNLMTEKEVSTWALRLPQIPSTNLKGNAFFDHIFSPWWKNVNQLKNSGLYFSILPYWYYPFKGSLPNHWLESIDAKFRSWHMCSIISVYTLYGMLAFWDSNFVIFDHQLV